LLRALIRKLRTYENRVIFGRRCTFRLAHALRKRGYDAIHAQELDRKGRSDSDQLQFAIQQERCLFTFNVKDFVILHNQHAKSRQEHWGIIVSKQLPFTEAMSKLLGLLQRYSKKTMKNHLEFL
jgi:predicted nuclease of predicted toxin-antitoxin system